MRRILRRHDLLATYPAGDYRWRFTLSLTCASTTIASMQVSLCSVHETVSIGACFFDSF
jgi:hypothetical protein